MNIYYALLCILCSDGALLVRTDIKEGNKEIYLSVESRGEY